MEKTWKLSSFDLFSLNMTIKGAWIYREAPDFMKMKESLAGIQELYPHLGGRYRESIKSLVWDDALAEPLPFVHCDLGSHSVDELSGGCNVWQLVKPFDQKGFKEGRVAPFSAILAKLKDGAVLFVQCAHATMDGATFYRLVSEWASLYRGEQLTGRMTVDQSLIPAPDALSKEETIRQVQEKGWLRVGGRQLVKMMWNLFRNSMVKIPYTLTVTQEEIGSVRMASGAGTNAVLTAIAMKALSRNMRGERNFKLLFVADLRGRIEGIGEDFFGNISQPVAADGAFDPDLEVSVLAAAIDESLKAALASGRAGDNVRLSQCSSHYGLPYFYFDASDVNSSDPGTIYVNNQLKFRACELDWGTGKPARVFPNELTDMVKFWQPVSGGPVEIIFGGLAAKIMRR